MKTAVIATIMNTTSVARKTISVMVCSPGYYLDRAIAAALQVNVLPVPTQTDDHRHRSGPNVGIHAILFRQMRRHSGTEASVFIVAEGARDREASDDGRVRQQERLAAFPNEAEKCLPDVP